MRERAVILRDGPGFGDGVGCRLSLGAFFVRCDFWRQDDITLKWLLLNDLRHLWSRQLSPLSGQWGDSSALIGSSFAMDICTGSGPFATGELTTSGEPPAAKGSRPRRGVTVRPFIVAGGVANSKMLRQ